MYQVSWSVKENKVNGTFKYSVGHTSNLKKVILELGGNGPFIAEPDCKLSDAVNSLILGFCFMQGEVCCASTRLYAHEDIYDEFVGLW